MIKDKVNEHLRNQLDKLLTQIKKKHGDKSDEYYDAINLLSASQYELMGQSFPHKAQIGNRNITYKTNVYFSYDDVEENYYLTNDDLRDDNEKFYAFQDKHTYKNYNNAYNALLKLSKK